MSDATATIVETPAKTGELRVESLHNSAEAAIESGDVSGVYRIAQNQVDETVTRELGISKIDDAQTAAVAGPEIIALKQADAELGNRTQAALGNLKTVIGSFNTPTTLPSREAPKAPEVTPAEAEEARLAAVAEKAMQEGPLTTEEMAADLEKHEAEESRKEMAKITPEEAATAIPLIIKREDPVITVEELKPEEQKEVQEVAALAELDEDIERGVQTFEKELAKIDAELVAEKKAFEDFNASHGMAHTKLEQAYLDALANRIAALEFEKKSHETGDVSLEAKAKAAELKQLADKAESSYQEMYNAFLHQPETASKESKLEKIGLHLDEEDENYEAQQYEQYHPGNTFGQIKSSGSARMTSGNGTFEGVSASQTQKPKGRFGKFIDGLKSWKYFTSKSS
ncbi:hypothetical protein IPH19_00540 [Candidatus Uhrbacteria bacterium]|nr:MAG: hypothetical protein IPH19_00540 [Candidatus Uhrbacteria bacterium]